MEIIGRGIERRGLGGLPSLLLRPVKPLEVGERPLQNHTKKDLHGTSRLELNDIADIVKPL